MAWLTKKNTFCVETCFTNKLSSVIQANFPRKFHCVYATSKPELSVWVQKFRVWNCANLTYKNLRDTDSGRKVSARTQTLLYVAQLAEGDIDKPLFYRVVHYFGEYSIRISS